MKWQKKGIILKADGQREWMISHIQNPCAVIHQDYVRVYFTTRPKPESGLFKAVISFCDLDKNDLSRVIRIADNPILEYGKIGTFDEFGMMPGGGVLKKRMNFGCIT